MLDNNMSFYNPNVSLKKSFGGEINNGLLNEK